MTTQKTPIYFVPGLGVGPEIFNRLNLSDSFEKHYIKWKKPLATNETISNYAMRMAGEIKHENPILIGVSFGGIMVQEMSKFVNAKQVIIISSVKSNTEFPKRFKFIGMSNIYKLFPTKFMTNFERYSKFFIGKTLQKKAENYKRYFTERNKTYLEWSIENVLKWQQVIPNDFVIHIHGTDDSVFPIKYIQNAIEIPNGNHAMIITKAKEISEILNNKMIIT